MEVAAGYAEHVDVQVGRLIDEIERLGHGDDTLIFYIWGDNRSSGEGQSGTISELLGQNGIPTTVDMHIRALDELGGLDVLWSPKTDNQYHAGWAWAGSTPYKGMKLVASHLGGTRNPMVVRWTGHITPDPTPRTQFHHCNDLVPTIYEILGITPPRVVRGVEQQPLDGISFAYSFDDPDAEDRLRTQYFEIMGSRAIYHDGWMASAFGPRPPWVPGLPPGIQEWTPDQDMRSRARQPGQPARHRRRHPREGQRRALRAGWCRRGTDLLRGRRPPLLRVQPLHPDADQDPLRAPAPDRAGHHRGPDGLRRSPPRWSYRT